jgi:hypothetical protein
MQLDQLKHRAFITLPAARRRGRSRRAQQPARTRKVGLLHPGESTTVSARVAAIREGLNGPDNQRNSGIELVIRLADGDLSRLPALAKDLVNNRVDAIVAVAPAAVQAAAGASTTAFPTNKSSSTKSPPGSTTAMPTTPRPTGNSPPKMLASNLSIYTLQSD